MAETVFALFEEASARAPGGACLCAPPMAGRPYHPEGVEIDYRTARDRVAALRARYRAAGYGPGHRVALLLENRPAFHLHWWALNAAGAGIVPINPAYRQDETVWLIDHSESALIVSVPERVAALEAAARACTRAVPVVDASALPAPLPAPPRAPRSGAPGADDEAALLYTSGTTGRPKGCILTNRYFLNAGAWYREAGGLMAMEDGRERLLNPLPLHHANALAIGSMAMLATAGCIVMADRFHPRSWWADVATTRATIVHYLGIMPPLLLAQPPGPRDRAHRVKFGAGAGIDPKHHRLFEERFGFPLIEGWGMTEVAMPAWASVEPRRITTRAFGRPLPGCEMRVVDDEGRAVAAGVPGELVLRMTSADPRRGLFAGYLKDREATEEAWRGGWFHTGDIVTRAADGMFVFVDRKKNIIRRSGENIAAAEVEAALQADDRVAQAAVLAVPDELREEEVMACVVPAPGVPVNRSTAEALQDLCLERLAYYKAPGYLLFVDTLPVTGTQKVRKVGLFPPGADPRAAADCLDLRARKRAC